jgi:hypothetical protein
MDITLGLWVFHPNFEKKPSKVYEDVNCISAPKTQFKRKDGGGTFACNI